MASSSSERSATCTACRESKSGPRLQPPENRVDGRRCRGCSGVAGSVRRPPTAHAGNAPCAHTLPLPRRLRDGHDDICLSARCDGVFRTPRIARWEVAARNRLRSRSSCAAHRRAPTAVVGRSQHRSLRVRGTVRCLRSQSTVDDRYAGLPRDRRHARRIRRLHHHQNARPRVRRVGKVVGRTVNLHGSAAADAVPALAARGPLPRAVPRLRSGRPERRRRAENGLRDVEAQETRCAPGARRLRSRPVAALAPRRKGTSAGRVPGVRSRRSAAGARAGVARAAESSTMSLDAFCN